MNCLKSKGRTMERKAIIITGANGAIGSFLTEEYLKKDYFVLALIHNKQARITSLLAKYPNMLEIEKCDLTNHTVIKQLFTDFQQRLGFIPAKLIHTPALRSSDFVALAETEPQNWYSVVEMNIFSCYNMLHNLLPYYQQAEGGRIVIIGSNISRTGLKNGSAYAVSKGALANLARTVALEYGKDNIIINILSPGAVKADQSHFTREYQQFRQRYFEKELQETPLQKLVEPYDVFVNCEFLLSEQNRLISGEEIFITGGKL